MIRKILLATGAAALMSTPAWAHPGNGHSGEHANPHATTENPGHNQSGTKGKSGDHSKPGDHGNSGDHGKSHKCLPHHVGYVADGTLVSEALTQETGAKTYSGTLEVEVSRTNHHAAGDKGKTVTYEVSKAHLVFGLKDTNNDGTVGLDDLAKGDRVHLLGKIEAVAPKCKTETTGKATIRRIVFHAPRTAKS